MKAYDNSIVIDTGTKLRKNEANISRNVIMIIAIILKILMASVSISFVVSGLGKEFDPKGVIFNPILIGIGVTNILE